MFRRAVFLDRDGVLNQAMVREGKPYPPARSDTLVITPGAFQALAELRKRGFILICVTNQPDIARGARSLEKVEAMNREIWEKLSLDDFFMCPHDDSDRCFCRKPKPGMLQEAAQKWGLDLSQSWMIGDRAGDVAAGRAAGCQTIFIDRGYIEARPCPAADYTCYSLPEASAFIKNQRNSQT
jgi:D-glycero-D-manno-heptose 1,7-bisphosphate phosphatase